ncbi:MAG: class I tRNA ligase family protein, partial [Actinomycetota bacterium]
RGDQCDECGSLMDVKDLIDPKCKICGNKPIWKDTEHFFLKLSAFSDKISKWVSESSGWRSNAKNFTEGLLKIGIHDRDISRDSSWGIPVPIEGYENKSIYVWFEAVIGYLSASKEYSLNIGQPDLWKNFWENKDAIHYYFHGKDNIPFHTVIWPSMLMGVGGLTLPTRVYSSEYLIFEGKQFSKSRNWGIWLPEFLEKYDPDTLRFYLGGLSSILDKFIDI